MPVSSFLKFPFRVEEDHSASSTTSEHVREMILQILFTNPRERVFRPEYGAGIRRLIFEPNDSLLQNLLEKRLISSLTEALYGFVDPKTLKIEMGREEEKVLIYIGYTLAAVNYEERVEVPLD